MIETGRAGRLLASGRDADVFDYGPGLVLRRYRHGGDTAHEIQVMRHVAAHGFPVPRVRAAEGPDLVLERLAGRTALAALVDGQITPEAVAVHLADLHRRLHAVPALVSPGPDRSVLHLDLHPDNVMLTPSGPVVIDWRNATDGAPQTDVALTAVILAQVAVDTRNPLAGAARACLIVFLTRVGRLPAETLAAAVAYRNADPALSTTERSMLASAGGFVQELQAVSQDASGASGR